MAKGSRKQPNTPKSKVRSAIRQLWLRSRERAARLKQDGYCCVVCNRKQSKAKGKEFAVEVHHVHGIDWEGITESICERVLQDPSRLVTLCRECHEKTHREE